MSVMLRQASQEDIETVWKMQTEAFRELYEKYQDKDTSPATEPVEKVQARFNMEGSYYFFIDDGDDTVGVIRIIDRNDGSRKRISPLWIMKEFRGKGYAQKAILEAERMFGKDNWSLDTILQEEGNCYLYEKMGYKRTGIVMKINDRMDIVFYEKD